jgi:hypothetical protein
MEAEISTRCGGDEDEAGRTDWVWERNSDGQTLLLAGLW